MLIKRLTHAVITAFLLVFAAHSGLDTAGADDAEIYLGDAPPGSEPFIMFSLEYRPNAGSTVCTDYEKCRPIFEKSGFIPEDETDVEFFELLRAALSVVVQEVEGVNVGIMLNNDDPRGDCAGEVKAGCSNGGYIALDFVPLHGEDLELNRDLVGAVLGTMPTPKGVRSHMYQGRELFFEFYRYMKGLSVFNGHSGFTSYDGNSGEPSENIFEEYNADWSAENLPAGRNYPALVDKLAEHRGFAPDPKAETPVGGTYRGPLLDAGACSRIYTVNFIFQTLNHENDSDDQIKLDIPSLPSSRPKGPKGGGGGGQPAQPTFEEMIFHLNQTGVGPVPGSDRVTSYFFVDPRFEKGKANNYAVAGGTNSARVISEDPEKLVEDLKGLFDEILSVSTTFVSAALPINTFDRAQLRDDVFLALFQPQLKYAIDGEELPVGPTGDNRYWWGNVKKLRIAGLDSAAEVPELQDSRGELAPDADGRIKNSALTFWTLPTGAAMNPLRDEGNELAKTWPNRDGRSVNRGGMGQRIPGFQDAFQSSDPHSSTTRRVIYDHTPTSFGELTKSAASAIRDSIGASGTDTEKESQAERLISFMKGFYPDANNDPGEPLNWWTASVMHSRPATVNYGAPSGSSHDRDNPLVYVAFGSNDGTFRFVRNTAPGNLENASENRALHIGKEAWAFAPRAAMSAARRIFLDPAGEVRFPRESTVYGVDGPPTVWVEDNNGDGSIDKAAGDKAYVFFGLRRGGRAYYGLDVTDPESPELMWAIDGEAEGQFDGLGLSFSQPAVGYVRLDEDNPRLVVIFGGGYDRQYDHDAPVDTPLGVGIYVVDALSGELLDGGPITHPDMSDSIPSAVAAIDTVGQVSGLLDRMYVGDLGGNVWRVDMPPGKRVGEWPISRLASLGRHATAAGPEDNRRFFHRPDVVKADAFKDASGQVLANPFDAVIIGSGDRENPRDMNVENYMFMLRDRAVGVRDVSPIEDENISLASLEDVTLSVNVQIDADMDGWALGLGAPGEKGLATPLTISNTVLFTTYVPNVVDDPNDPNLTRAELCGPREGTGRFYTVSLQNANPFVGRDRPISDWDDAAAPADRYILLNSGGIPAEVVLITANRVLRPDLTIEQLPVSSRWRTFWHLDEVPAN